MAINTNSEYSKSINKSVNLFCQGNSEGALKILTSICTVPQADTIKDLFNQFQKDQTTGKPDLGTTSQPQLAQQVKVILCGKVGESQNGQQTSNALAITNFKQNNCQFLTHTDHCPQDIFLEIFSHFDLETLLLCTRVCKVWNKIVTACLCRVEIPSQNAFQLVIAQNLNATCKDEKQELIKFCESNNEINISCFSDFIERVMHIQNSISNILASLTTTELKKLEEKLHNQNTPLFFKHFIFILEINKKTEVRNRIGDNYFSLGNEFSELIHRGLFKTGLEMALKLQPFNRNSGIIQMLKTCIENKEFAQALKLALACPTIALQISALVLISDALADDNQPGWALEIINTVPEKNCSIGSGPWDIDGTFAKICIAFANKGNYEQALEIANSLPANTFKDYSPRYLRYSTLREIFVLMGKSGLDELKIQEYRSLYLEPAEQEYRSLELEREKTESLKPTLPDDNAIYFHFAMAVLLSPFLITADVIGWAYKQYRQQ